MIMFIKLIQNIKIMGSKSVFFYVALSILFACKQGPKTPDVSGIKVNLQVIRFEQAFFSVDTNHIDEALFKLNNDYPGFTKDYLFNILGTTPDSASKDIRLFHSTYRRLFDSTKQLFSNIKPIEQALNKGLQFVKYYYPKYAIPTKLVTFIGPINSYGNIITTYAFGIGLQLYMGNNYSLYNTEMAQELYPSYISRRFDQAYIPVNCMKNIIDDMYPNKNLGKPLVEQMVEAGKRQYLLKLFLPNMADTLTTGFTALQLATCNSNEASIWRYFIQNNLLYESNPDITKDYMNDGPNTPAISTDAPGLIGQYVGTNIVLKWLNKKGMVSPDILMQTPAKQIFEEAKYRPN
jgi:hypothetical protein